MLADSIQAHHRWRALARAQRPSEQPRRTPERDRPDHVLDPVAVDRELAVVDVARERSPSLEAVVQSPSRPVPSVARRRCASSQACSESASGLVVLLIHAVSRLDAMHSRPPVCLEGRVLNQPGRRTTVVPGRTTRTMSPWFSSPVPVWMVALCALAMPATNDRPMPLPRTGVLATR